MRRHSPYNYAFDNPIIFIDPDGMWPFPSLDNLVNTAKNEIRSYVSKKVNEVANNLAENSKELLVSIADAVMPDAIGLNADGEGSLPVGGVSINVGVGMVTTGDNRGDVFGTFDIGANIASSGFSLSGTAGATIYNNDKENFSADDISGARKNTAVTAGAKYVGKYEYTKGVPTNGDPPTTAHYVGGGYGVAYTPAPLIPLPLSVSHNWGGTQSTTFGNIFKRKDE